MLYAKESMVQLSEHVVSTVYPAHLYRHRPAVVLIIPIMFKPKKYKVQE